MPGPARSATRCCRRPRASSPSSSTGGCSRAASRSTDEEARRAIALRLPRSQAGAGAGRRGRARRRSSRAASRPRRPHGRGRPVRRQRRPGAVRRDAAPVGRRLSARLASPGGSQHVDRRPAGMRRPLVGIWSSAPGSASTRTRRGAQRVRLNLDLGSPRATGRPTRTSSRWSTTRPWWSGCAGWSRAATSSWSRPWPSGSPRSASRMPACARRGSASRSSTIRSRCAPSGSRSSASGRATRRPGDGLQTGLHHLRQLTSSPRSGCGAGPMVT